MDSMDMSGTSSTTTNSSTMSSSSMMVVFNNNISTSLFSLAWTPTNTATYAATCIFLAGLAIFLRVIMAMKEWQEGRWIDRELNRRYVVVQGKLPLAEQLSRESMVTKPGKVVGGASGGAGGGAGAEVEEMMTETSSTRGRMTLSENGIEEDVLVVRKRRSHVLPWRMSIDPVRAVLDTLVAGTAYLLMLAVMTVNLGYFLAILGGTFLGSLLVGRYTVATEH